MNLEEKLNPILSQKRLTVALAESCTGGLISSRITDVAGSSDYFMAGFVTYSNKAKEDVLQVPAGVLEEKGAVSAETAAKMAEGARAVAQVDIALAVTGIAGPGGGSAEKPVGTVYLALAADKKTIVRKRHFTGSRLEIKRQTADEALTLLLDYLEGGTK
jgi:PncC family amidohydrolase